MFYSFGAQVAAPAIRTVEEERPRTEFAVLHRLAAPAVLPTIYRSLSTGDAAPIQVSDPDEPQEREADEVAYNLTPGSGRTRRAGEPPLDGVQRVAVTGRAAPLRADPTPADPGHPLPPSALAWAEPRFGTTFDHVRVHSGGGASRATDQVSARAFTVGSHITFAAGQYAPDTPSGRRLLAHELTHVVHGGGSGAAARKLRRQPRAAEVPNREQVLQRAVEDLETRALPAFQQATDAVSESRVRVAGMSVAALCATIDGIHRELGLPAPGQSAEPPLIGPPAPGPEGERDRLARQHQNVSVLLPRLLTVQQFCGHPVLPDAAPPATVTGDLAPYAIQRTDSTAWVMRDARALLALLRHETFPDADQWTAIGLLRQHLNPWEFAYMLAVVRAESAMPHLDALSVGPRAALRSLTESIGQIRAATPIGPADEPALLELHAAEGTIRLLQPLSGAEIAMELYGNQSAWTDLVVAYNRVLRGRDPASWLERGTVIVVAVDQLIGNYKLVFGYARLMRSTNERGGSDPYLNLLSGDDTLVVGNTVSLGVVWPDSFFANVQLRWWAENDPVAVREQGIPARVQWPDGTLSMVPEQTRNASIRAVATAPGRHVLKCQLTMSTGHLRTLERSVTVLTLEEKLAAETRRELSWTRRPDRMLDDLRKERDRLQPGSSQHRQVESRITEIERTLSDADKDQRRYQGHSAHLSGIRAIYVSAEDTPMTVPLSIFVDSDPAYFDAPDYVLKLWDFTLRGSIRTYRGRGERPHEALSDVLRTFADDAPYPTGAMRFEITPLSMGYSGVRREILTCRTDGGTRMAPALRALSMVAMGVGVVSAAALQAEIAIPAFAVAGVLAGAGGTFSLYDRLEHGDFAWDLQTGLDLLDIAGAVLTVGVSSAGTRVVGGVGRASLGGTAQLAVGTVQIGVMAGVHVGQVAEAIASGDRDRTARALLSALADGALILIVHRAASRLGGARGVPREIPGPTQTPPEVVPRRTATGTVSPEGTPSAPTARPGTPEYRRQVHDQWVEGLRQSGLAERPASARVAEPLAARDDIPTIEEAHRIYDDILARDSSREVGIYRNNASGAYAVRVGSEMAVSGPRRGSWEAVLHFHPNEANVLTHRMPAPADVDGAATAALRSGHPVTEFTDFPLPGGRRGRCAYRATPTGEVTIDFVRPDGSRVSRSFASVGDYQRAYGARTTYLDPSSPEYRWVVEDLHDYYGGERPSGGGIRTARGTSRAPGEPTAREVEAAARRESMEWWQSPGVTTDARFARHEQTFNSIAATLRNAMQVLRSQGRGQLLPRVNEAVLTEPVDMFIRRVPRLHRQWTQMEVDAMRNPDLRQQMDQFLEGSLKGAGSREVGSRRPDLVEFFLEHGDVVVTDVVYSNDGTYLRMHAFKTDFYRAVVTTMIGGRGGPRVSGLDLNLRPAFPEARVTP
ncbi:uncharacterized protein DUF4157 [Kribbella sp. VKM Ac-2569]|uniref:eCIS core domain-containing protein n=1 Tax=Kribbella sp. VKM Ac-2569 TaxID=2512220 RepID=UPI0010D9A399|nr:DUF4157 domain-containing protein [Kribbella sp. VKM Ac-2569]RZT17530.1 uncharacterized protein DUF4157 [Kribbella sp. VKM Ac-2569]